MFADVILTQEDTLNEGRITQERIVVIIDVLRVSSTIVTALANGAEKILPLLHVQDVFTGKEQLISKGIPPDKILMGGERMGMKVRGFDLGNSPLEYSPQRVNGKTLIISSTNGTKAITRSKNAVEIIVGSFLNADASGEYLAGKNQDTVFYLSGKEGRFSLEDAVGAGMIIDSLGEKCESLNLSDSALMCLYLYEKFKADPFHVFLQGEHGKYLDSIGLMEDLRYCAKANIINKVPTVCNDGFVRWAEAEAEADAGGRMS